MMPQPCLPAGRLQAGVAALQQRGAGEQPFVGLRLQRRQGFVGGGLRHAYNLSPPGRVGASRVPFIFSLFYQGKVRPTVHTVRRGNAAKCWTEARGEGRGQGAASIWRVVFFGQDVDHPSSGWPFR